MARGSSTATKVSSDSNDKVSVDDGNYPGFSERLNGLLDKANYPPLDYGRARYLAEEFGVSKSGARKWIREDVPPRPATLRAMVEKLYQQNHMALLRNTSKAIAWLQYGDEVKSSNADKLITQADHVLLSRIYIAVHQCARKLKIDLETLPHATLDRLYDTIINQTLKQGSDEPDEALIASILQLAQP